jgi:hypothetical protein
VIESLPGQRSFVGVVPVPCSRCGRLLLAETSICRGIGPECARREKEERLGEAEEKKMEGKEDDRR